MSVRKPLVLALGMLFAALQGCQGSHSTAPDGDRSNEGTGAVAFRLSQQNVERLRTQDLRLSYMVFGPGMDTVRGSSILDTVPIMLAGIPCGTRIVQVDAVDAIGRVSWSGRDTTEINPNQTSEAHVILHRVDKKGRLLIDVVLDSLDVADTLLGQTVFDTVWTRTYYHGYFSYVYHYCNPSERIGFTDTIRTNCYHTEMIAYLGDTTWSHAVTHSLASDGDTSCSGGPRDSSSTWGAYSCTIWDFEPLPKYDTIWRDSVVHTQLYAQTSICTPPNVDSLIYCYHGIFEPMSPGWCERIENIGGYPTGISYRCADTLMGSSTSSARR